MIIWYNTKQDWFWCHEDEVGYWTRDHMTWQINLKVRFVQPFSHPGPLDPNMFLDYQRLKFAWDMPVKDWDMQETRLTSIVSNSIKVVVVVVVTVVKVWSKWGL